MKGEVELYEEGKDRRYKLLFAVNGGAFAVAKLLVGEEGKRGAVLGGLRLWELSVGMGFFTALMVVDIFAFGLKMRRKKPEEELFGPVGQGVLGFLGLLMVAGWALVAVPVDEKFGDPKWAWWWIVLLVVVYVLVYLGMLLRCFTLIERHSQANPPKSGE
jgi:amino acid transporter